MGLVTSRGPEANMEEDESPAGAAPDPLLEEEGEAILLSGENKITA